VPGAALLLLLVYFAASAVVLLIGDSLSDEQVGPMFYVAAAVVAPLMATYVGLIRYAPDERTSAALRIELPQAPRGRTYLHIFLGVVCGVALVPLVLELSTSLADLIPKEPVPDEAVAEWIAAVQQPATQALIVVSGVTGELFFRGFMLPRLVGTAGLLRAIALVALFDLSTSTMQPLGPVAAVVAAVPCGLLVLAARSTWPAIAARLAFFLALLVAPADLVITQRTLGMLLGSTVVAAAAVALSWRLRVLDSAPVTDPSAGSNA
jgi:hypothetical protein